MAEVQKGSNIRKVMTGVFGVISYAGLSLGVITLLEWSAQIGSQLFVLGLLLLGVLYSLIYLIEIRTALWRLI
jgi:hypothetical protein